jgi:uncharacterized membrane protein
VEYNATSAKGSGYFWSRAVNTNSLIVTNDGGPKSVAVRF